MSDELRDLYQEVILDHSRKPRNFGEPTGANRHAQGTNPLCGDRATVHLLVDGDVVKDAGFVGSGCSISTASASMMTESIKGHSMADAGRLAEAFKAVMTANASPDLLAEAEELQSLQGVKRFPVRVKCALLPWTALTEAMELYRQRR